MPAVEPNDAEKKAGLYDYGKFSDDVLTAIRRETFGEDLGQFSWTTADELRRFSDKLQLDARAHLLDVACGSGGPALFIARSTGCRVTGVDINESGIESATHASRELGLNERANFEHVDGNSRLPFADGSFDAIISIDAMNHFPQRAELLAEWHRILRPSGRFLFTDAVVITGTLTRDEIFARSNSMGLFIFTPVGVHEENIQGAGFTDVEVEDVTENIAGVSARWHGARAKRRNQLLQKESEREFETLQNMLAAAHTLSSEGRLSRFAYFARKPSL